MEKKLIYKNGEPGAMKVARRVRRGDHVATRNLGRPVPTLPRANLSTERVIMETDTLSCVRENGEHFKAAMRGYTAGEDSSFGSTGTFISKQGQVLLAAVLANIAKNAGEAVALAQQSTTVVGVDKAASATNVTGSKSAFVAGKSMVDASATVAQWCAPCRRCV